MINNIAIITTVANFDLYSKTAPLFPANIQKYVIDGTNGMHAYESMKYMFKTLKNKEIDWLIMADEDVVFKESDSVFELIDYMKLNNFSVCGVRDGGVIPHRNQNPYLINTFFSIMHFSEIKKIWNEKEVSLNNFIQDNEFHDDLEYLTYNYNINSLYEPYYCFYLWLRRKGKKILFLDSDQSFNDDLISNSVKDVNGNVMLYHTWYARAYNVNLKHTLRINKVLNSLNVKTSNEDFVKPIILKDKTFLFRNNICRLINKIKMKVETIL